MAFDWRMLLSGLAAAAPQLAEAKAARRQQAELDRGEMEALAAQKRADDALGNQVTKLEQSGPGEAQQESRAGYAQALKKARMQTVGPNVGGDRYQEQLKTANASSAAYGARTGDFYAAIDAPARQRDTERQGFERAQSAAADAGRQADMAQYLAKIRAQRIRPNPWAKFLSGIGSQIASNYDLRGPKANIGSYGDYLPPPPNARVA